MNLQAASQVYTLSSAQYGGYSCVELVYQRVPRKEFDNLRTHIVQPPRPRRTVKPMSQLDPRLGLLYVCGRRKLEEYK